MELSNDEIKNQLCTELEQLGIKHNRLEIIKIAKVSSGSIIFLEKGNKKSGLIHILENHRQDFINRGILETEIPDFIIKAVVQGNLIGIQGKSRKIYEFVFNNSTHYLSLEISTNGYIVSANPTPTRLIVKYKQGGKL
jgi:hypothetical protein